MEEIAGGRSIVNFPLYSEKNTHQAPLKRQVPENLKLILQNFLSMETIFSTMHCEQKLYICVYMCKDGSSPLWVGFRAFGWEHRLFRGSPGWQSWASASCCALAAGSSIVLLVKKENAPKCGGDGNNLNFVSNCVGFSIFITLNRFLLHVAVSFCLLSFPLPCVFVSSVSKLQLTWSCAPLLTCSWSVRSHSLYLLKNLSISIERKCSELGYRASSWQLCDGIIVSLVIFVIFFG